MSIEDLLKQLVAQIKGANGAIVLETDGEAVQWHPVADADRLRLRGAYAALALNACRASAIRGEIGIIRSLILKYEHASLVVQEIDRDCFVVVELGPSANIAQALFHLEPVLDKLRDELEL